MRRTATALITAALLGATSLTGIAGPVAASEPHRAHAATATTLTTPVTNLAHLDFLSDRVAVASSAAHSTYRLPQDPKVGVVWVYADSAPAAPSSGSVVAI